MQQHEDSWVEESPWEGEHPSATVAMAMTESAGILSFMSWWETLFSWPMGGLGTAPHLHPHWYKKGSSGGFWGLKGSGQCRAKAESSCPLP